MSDFPSIRPVAAEEQSQASAAIAEAFADYPLYRYFFDSADQRRYLCKVRRFVEFAVRCYPQSLYTDGRGVWLLYVRKGDKTVFPGVGTAWRALVAASGMPLLRAVRFFGLAARAERAGKPQGGHLVLLATEGGSRGKGYASKVLDALRAQGAFYLETHSPTNVAIYLHKGGRLLSATPFGKNLTHSLIAFEKAAPQAKGVRRKTKQAFRHPKQAIRESKQEERKRDAVGSNTPPTEGESKPSDGKDGRKES